MSYRLRDNRYPEKGREHRIEKPTVLHKRFFRWLDPYYYFKYLDTCWLTYLEPGEAKYPHNRQIRLSQQLGWLYQAPNFYLDRHEDQNYSVNKFRRPAVYNLDKGREHLPYPYKTPYYRSHEYAHEFLVDMGFYAPLLSAVLEDDAFNLIDTWQLLHEHPLFPERTKAEERPFTFSLENESVILDGRPVVLLRTRNTVTEAICIPGVQVERVTKGVQERVDGGSSVGKHLRHAIEIFEAGMFEERYGFDRIILPFIFSSKKGIQTAEAQMNLAMRFVRDVLKKNPRYLIFKAIEHLPTMENYPKPSPALFLSPWKTVSGEEFRFDDSAFFVK